MNLKQHFDLIKASGFNAWIRQLQLNLGAYLMRRGAGLQPGQPVRVPAGTGPSMTGHGTVVRRKAQTYWIQNMYFNFNLNKVTYKWSEKPILKISDKFNNSKQQAAPAE